MVRIVKDPEERRSDIIMMACQLFLSKGYNRTTMKDIMEQLQIAKGTIYHYFSSKEELLDAVIISVAEEEIQRLKTIFDHTEGTALERLKQLILNGNSRHDDIHDETIKHLHKAANAEMHIRLLAQLVTLQAQLYAELFKQGCDEGLFKTESPLECAEFLLSGIQFLTDLGIYPWNQEQLERRWTAFPGIIESFLQAPRGSFNFLLEIMR